VRAHCAPPKLDETAELLCEPVPETVLQANVGAIVQRQLQRDAASGRDAVRELRRLNELAVAADGPAAASTPADLGALARERAAASAARGAPIAADAVHVDGETGGRFDVPMLSDPLAHGGSLVGRSMDGEGTSIELMLPRERH
jgi:hypothetical protein